MSAPPEAKTEYSRGSAILRGLHGWHRRRAVTARAEPEEVPRAAVAGVVVCALLGALLVIVSQFTPLYHVHSLPSAAALETVGTGANHAFAPVPLALLAIWFAVAVTATGSRAALLGLLVLGLATLGIALLGDLPDVHATGLVGSSASQYVQATSTAGVGLYVETLGAVLLLISGGIGLLLVVRRPAPAGGRPPGLASADR
jgi:hypothetical protein